MSILTLPRMVVRRLARATVAEQQAAERTSIPTRIALTSLAAQYRRATGQGGTPIDPANIGFRVFSQFDEDGIILYLLATVGFGTRRFVDIGAGDGVHASNCANLALNLGFHGLLIDSDESNVRRGRDFYAAHPASAFYPPVFVQAFITRENVNGLIADAGFTGDVDLLSIDIDGNDYWVWQAIDVISPRVVVIESRVEYGSRSVVAPYDSEFRWSSSSPHRPHGASPAALVKLGRSKGYRLVATNRFGFNLFFVRDDLGRDALHEVPASRALEHPRSGERSEEVAPEEIANLEEV